MKLLNNEKVIVGYDLNDNYSQISYCIAGNEKVETISSVAGTEVFSIPTVLCKKEGVNQWFYGKEAIRYARENNGILVENLLSLAVTGEPMQIDGNSIHPVALLTLFLKRSLGMLSQISSPDRIAALMISCESLEGRVMEVLQQAILGLRLKTDRIFFQNHTESFYYYMIYQPEELWRQQVLLCEYREQCICTYRMDWNRHTTPIVAFVEENQTEFPAYDPMPESEKLCLEKQQRMDAEFLKLVKSLCQDRLISSVFLIGEHYSEKWMKESLRYLCKGRRVFQGNNLYSKGACYAMLELLQESEVGRQYIFLGKDKLKFNIGMKVLRRGQESYYALLDAGLNWFEAETTLEFYLQQGNCIELILTSLMGRSSKLAQIILENLPEGISRLKAHLCLKSETLLLVEIEDLGFGEFRKTTGQVWSEEINLV